MPLPAQPFRPAGFTLAEIMTVVALIGILTLIGSSLNFNRITDKEKAGRFENTVASLLRSEIGKTVSGKSVAQGGILEYPTSTRIDISKDRIFVGYYSGSTLVQTGSVLSRPFFWDPSYEILEIRTENQSGNYTLTGSDIARIELGNAKDPTLTYSGNANGTGTLLEIVTSYHANTGSIRYDSRSNVIETK